MKSLTEFYSSTNTLFIEYDCNKIVDKVSNKKNLIYRAETSSIINNFPDIMWINIEQIT